MSTLEKIREEIEQTAKDYDKFDDYRRVRGLWIALEIIEKYAEQEPKWIPVSERLPEDAYGCLVTVEIDNVSTSECVPTILNYWVGYDGETWNNSDGIPIPFEVIAWMPLPKPYEPHESEG